MRPAVCEIFGLDTEVYCFYANSQLAILAYRTTMAKEENSCKECFRQHNSPLYAACIYFVDFRLQKCQ